MAIAVSRENAVLVNGKGCTFRKDNPCTEGFISLHSEGGGGGARGILTGKITPRGSKVSDLKSSPQFLSDTISTVKVECVINFWTG